MASGGGATELYVIAPKKGSLRVVRTLMAKQVAAYETLVQKVFSQILAQSAVKTIDVRKNVVVQGKTTKHEIDVFWEFELSGLKYTTIIQAKDWATKVPQGEILKLKAVLDDVPGQPKGIFVTRTGYQAGAEQFALANGIGLYEFREPNEADWQGKLKEININLRMFVPNAELIRFEFDEPWIRDPDAAAWNTSHRTDNS